MGLFKGKKSIAPIEDADTLSFRFGKWCKAKEMHLADYLNRNTKTWDYRSWLILLISFCMVAGGYLIYLLTGIFN